MGLPCEASRSLGSWLWLQWFVFSSGRGFWIAGPRSASRLQVDRSLPYPQGVESADRIDSALYPRHMERSYILWRRLWMSSSCDFRNSIQKLRTKPVAASMFTTTYYSNIMLHLLPNNWRAFFAWPKHDFGITIPALSKCQLAKDSPLHSTGSKRYFANHCTWRLWLCW